MELILGSTFMIGSPTSAGAGKRRSRAKRVVRKQKEIKKVKKDKQTADFKNQKIIEIRDKLINNYVETSKIDNRSKKQIKDKKSFNLSVARKLSLTTDVVKQSRFTIKETAAIKRATMRNIKHNEEVETKTGRGLKVEELEKKVSTLNLNDNK